jgi:hypothetical protein
MAVSGLKVGEKLGPDHAGGMMPKQEGANQAAKSCRHVLKGR